MIILFRCLAREGFTINSLSLQSILVAVWAILTLFLFFHGCSIYFWDCPLQELTDALAKDDMPSYLPTNDLRKTKGAFIKHAVAKMDANSDDASPLLSKREKYDAACKLWMDSAVRAVLTMSKQPGFALITAR